MRDRIKEETKADEFQRSTPQTTVQRSTPQTTVLASGQSMFAAKKQARPEGQSQPGKTLGAISLVSGGVALVTGIPVAATIVCPPVGAILLLIPAFIRASYTGENFTDAVTNSLGFLMNTAIGGLVVSGITLGAATVADYFLADEEKKAPSLKM